MRIIVLLILGHLFYTCKLIESGEIKKMLLISKEMYEIMQFPLMLSQTYKLHLNDNKFKREHVLKLRVVFLLFLPLQFLHCQPLQGIACHLPPSLPQ